jgi:hypothetical protein
MPHSTVRKRTIANTARRLEHRFGIDCQFRLNLRNSYFPAPCRELPVRDRAHLLRGHPHDHCPRRYVLCDDRPRAYYCSIADGHAW